jgi:hypothetical protein
MKSKYFASEHCAGVPTGKVIIISEEVVINQYRDLPLNYFPHIFEVEVTLEEATIQLTAMFAQ